MARPGDKILAMQSTELPARRAAGQSHTLGVLAVTGIGHYPRISQPVEDPAKSRSFLVYEAWESTLRESYAKGVTITRTAIET